MKRLLLVLAALVSLSAHGAQIQTGNDLLRLSTGNELDKVFVYGYLSGVTQSEEFARAIGEMSKGGLAGFGFYCSPPGSDVGQAKDVVVRWLTEHPDRRHELALVLVRTALLEVWRCPSK